jgi:hypothetical protein
MKLRNRLTLWVLIVGLSCKKAETFTESSILTPTYSSMHREPLEASHNEKLREFLANKMIGREYSSLLFDSGKVYQADDGRIFLYQIPFANLNPTTDFILIAADSGYNYFQGNIIQIIKNLTTQDSFAFFGDVIFASLGRDTVETVSYERGFRINMFNSELTEVPLDERLNQRAESMALLMAGPSSLTYGQYITALTWAGIRTGSGGLWGDLGWYNDIYIPIVPPSGGGGGSSSTVNPNLEYLSNVLYLSSPQRSYLINNPTVQAQVLHYVTFSAHPIEIIYVNARNHINGFMEYPAYQALVNEHAVYGDATKMWFEDVQWLGNASNFSLGMTASGQWDQLTPEEKNLIVLYPFEAFQIKQNVPNALARALAEVSPNSTDHIGHQDKIDAFRHAYFQAINVRDVTDRWIIPYVVIESDVSIVTKFANAHESMSPQQLIKEKQMDVFNNTVGINYGATTLPIIDTDNSVAAEILTKLNNGQLVYLKPLDHNLWEFNQPFHSTCVHGISSNTQTIPTNQ